MNEHEAERIAAAMHELRPDWPTASVLTLIRKNLLAKPRRDVTVALAWVACESASHTPARVLELGPWWQAAGIEGAVATRPEKLATGDRCTACGNGQVHRLHPDDHPFMRPTEDKYDGGPTVEAIRAQLRELPKTPTPAPRPSLDELARSPRTQAIRDEMAAAREALAAGEVGVGS